MLTYNMDVGPDSIWRRTTPSAAALAQPYYCTEAGVFYGRSGFATARTNKQSYILFYTLHGAGLITQDGVNVTLGPGQALLMDCRSPQSYGTAPGEEHWDHYWVHLDGTGVAAMARLLELQQRLTPVPLTEASKVKRYFDEILREIEGDTVDSTVHVGLMLHQLLALCAQGLSEQSEAATSRQTILRAARHIRRSYQNDLCLSDLLDEAHMSKSYFLRLFRRYMGTTPYNYLVNYRITQAKELLVLTDQSVASIAREVGFGDASNFSTRFSQAVGQSPLQYRKTALKGSAVI